MRRPGFCYLGGVERGLGILKASFCRPVCPTARSHYLLISKMSIPQTPPCRPVCQTPRFRFDEREPPVRGDYLHKHFISQNTTTVEYRLFTHIKSRFHSFCFGPADSIQVCGFLPILSDNAFDSLNLFPCRFLLNSIIRSRINGQFKIY